MYEHMEECRVWIRDFRARFPGSMPLQLGGYHARIMLARRLDGEAAHGLPPGDPTPAYPVWRYKGCPESWSRRGDAFFVPIPLGDDGKGPGMWYDWTDNALGAYDCAVIPSTTGMNPITGQKTDALRLERYDQFCPVHNVAFEAERFCSTCAFRWPSQNYVASPNVLWWDGFRRPDGTVRQFSFSDDIMQRDVGVAVLGQDRVPAFGFAFFRAKTERPEPVRQLRHQMFASHELVEVMGIGMTLGGEPKSADIAWDSKPLKTMLGGLPSGGIRDERTRGGAPRTTRALPIIRRAAASVQREVEREVVAVGAGARITQDLRPDPKRLDEWRNEPDAVITVHFVAEEQAIAILEGPQYERNEAPEGFLQRANVALGD